MFGKLWKSATEASPGGLSSPSVYRRYRVDGRALNHKIMSATLDKAAIQFAAGALDMMGRDNVVFFDSEDETSVLMDCAPRYPGGCAQGPSFQWEVGGESLLRPPSRRLWPAARVHRGNGGLCAPIDFWYGSAVLGRIILERVGQFRSGEIR